MANVNSRDATFATPVVSVAANVSIDIDDHVDVH